MLLLVHIDKGLYCFRAAWQYMLSEGRHNIDQGKPGTHGILSRAAVTTTHPPLPLPSFPTFATATRHSVTLTTSTAAATTLTTSTAAATTLTTSVSSAPHAPATNAIDATASQVS